MGFTIRTSAMHSIRKKRNIRITRKSRNEVMHHLTQELAFTERVNEKGRAKLSPNVTKCQSSRRTFDNPRQIESRVIQNSLHVIAILGDGSWKRETMYIDNTLPKWSNG